MTNKMLAKAKANINDEYYTQYADIEYEIMAYFVYNPNVFQDKTILLPCDDYENSNFTKFFEDNFEKFKLKKLISTCFAIKSKEVGSLFKNMYKNEIKGKYFILDKNTKVYGYLNGNGDFRSEEVTKLRNEADIIITNPPFSLIREFLNWILVSKKEFSIIAPISTIGYKNVFPFIKENKIWIGRTDMNKEVVFGVPEGTFIEEKYKNKAKKLGYCGNYTRLGNTCWITNIPFKREKKITLRTMEANLKLSNHLKSKKMDI